MPFSGTSLVVATPLEGLSAALLQETCVGAYGPETMIDSAFLTGVEERGYDLFVGYGWECRERRAPADWLQFLLFDIKPGSQFL